MDHYTPNKTIHAHDSYLLVYINIYKNTDMMHWRNIIMGTYTIEVKLTVKIILFDLRFLCEIISDTLY